MVRLESSKPFTFIYTHSHYYLVKVIVLMIAAKGMGHFVRLVWQPKEDSTLTTTDRVAQR
jgi:hypothetical protein